MKVREFKEAWKKAIAKSDKVHIAGANGRKFAFLIIADGYELAFNNKAVDLYYRNKYIGWVDLSSVTDIN